MLDHGQLAPVERLEAPLDLYPFRVRHRSRDQLANDLRRLEVELELLREKRLLGLDQNGKIVAKIDSVFMTPTGHSGIK